MVKMARLNNFKKLLSFIIVVGWRRIFLLGQDFGLASVAP